jgi:alpha-tubulin suppressor-like RCC1 family protein
VRCFNDLKPNFQKAIYQKETDIFIWGKGEANSNSNFTNFHPHRLRSLEGVDKTPSFIDIVFGEQLAVAIDKQNNAYIWKEPRLKADKTENVNNHVRNDIVQIKKIKVVQSAITKDKIFFLSKDGGLYFINYKVSYPENKDSFFSIKSNEEIITIDQDKLVHVKELKNIKSIAAGKDHIIVLDKDGNIFGMGDDSYGND